ncbi:MAG: CDP-alcohol phosphatidyltransferase family protein [bacterium]
MKKLFRNLDQIKKVMHPDDWWTEFFVRPFSLRFVALIQDTRITPNQITMVSFICLLAGCLGILTGNHAGYILAAILLHISYVLDVADGLLARYKRQFSPFGGWMDGISDRIGEFLIIFCLTLQLGPVSVKTLFIGMFAVFLLAMYHGFINKNIPAIPQTMKGSHKSDQLGYINKIRQKIKFGFFNLGEQFFLYTLFLCLNKINLFFVVFILYGTVSLTSFSLFSYIRYYKHKVQDTK